MLQSLHTSSFNLNHYSYLPWPSVLWVSVINIASKLDYFRIYFDVQEMLINSETNHTAKHMELTFISVRRVGYLL